MDLFRVGKMPPFLPKKVSFGPPGSDKFLLRESALKVLSKVHISPLYPHIP